MTDDDAEGHRRASNGHGPARREDYRSARIGAAGALVAAVFIILIIDAFSAQYDANPVIVIAILGAATAMVGVELYDPRK